MVIITHQEVIITHQVLIIARRLGDDRLDDLRAREAPKILEAECSDEIAISAFQRDKIAISAMLERHGGSREIAISALL